MVSATFRIEKEKIAALLLGIVAVILILKEISDINMSGRKNADTLEKRISVAAELGIDITSCEEELSRIFIPETFGEALKTYNTLQTACGFDLSAYKNTLLDRYSYTFGQNGIRLDLLIFDGRLVGGDLYLTDECRYYSLTALKNGEVNGNYQDR